MCLVQQNFPACIPTCQLWLKPRAHFVRQDLFEPFCESPDPPITFCVPPTLSLHRGRWLLMRISLRSLLPCFL